MAAPAPAPTEVALDVDGMSCASCAARIERKLNRLDGVEATVNLRDRAGDGARRRPVTSPSSSARSRPPATTRASAPTRERARPRRAARTAPPAARAAVLTVPLVALAMVPPLQFAGWEWLALALATPVVFGAGAGFHRAALATPATAARRWTR